VSLEFINLKTQQIELNMGGASSNPAYAVPDGVGMRSSRCGKNTVLELVCLTGLGEGDFKVKMRVIHRNKAATMTKMSLGCSAETMWQASHLGIASYNSFQSLALLESSDAVAVQVVKRGRLKNRGVVAKAICSAGHLHPMDPESEICIYLSEGGVEYSSAVQLSVAPVWPPPKACLKLRRIHSYRFCTTKSIYFIRHAQSMWNKAQHRMDVLGMYSKRDHGLSRQGIAQALELRKMLLTCCDASQDDAERLFNADKIFSSPCARALQTALLALQDLPCASKQGIKLMPAIREIKSLGGVDNLGTRGSEILKKTKSHLENALGPTEWKELMSSFASVDMYNTSEVWWDSTFEDASDVNDRLDAFMDTIRYSPAQNAIFVSHSNLFKRFCARFASPNFELVSDDSGPPLSSKRLFRKKVRNASVVRLDVCCSVHGAWLQRAEYLFGTFQ